MTSIMFTINNVALNYAYRDQKVYYATAVHINITLYYALNDDDNNNNIVTSVLLLNLI